MDSNDKQTGKNKTFFRSVRHALTGVRTAFTEEDNLKRDATFSIVVILLGFMLRVSAWDWLLLSIAIAIVVISEMWNTVFENMVDLVVHHQYDPLAKKIKDMSAGTVLLTAFFSSLIGLYVFVPYLWRMLF
ncbi:hypothetical protein IV38_GL000409 [Lactobacillus selangorensis]|uniref:Diacylglycerol kinase n=2 Tax=Lactobacillus selangorensis TaxID=81857 RepID=A0A0R2FX72_9LACO|nr:hypothetical protein IV38_GL000409 [Lactobacillus selangorensis]KRN33946.1 hypothetical protein IV40_GL000259 [Lactobacillus selangorensis]